MNLFQIQIYIFGF